ncbi:MAG: TonB-dependent receptor [Taibaiella sp.]|nr:TonB-dependent receptor [Taibaiella sp.]
MSVLPTRQNVDKSFRRGVELSAWTALAEAWELQAHLTVSQNKINSFTEYIDDYDNGGQLEIEHKHTDIALSPSVIGGMTITYNAFRSEKNNLDLSLIGKYIGRQYLDNTSDKGRSIDPYGLLNFRMAYQFHLAFTRQCSISLNVNNILNQRYASKGYSLFLPV